MSGSVLVTGGAGFIGSHVCEAYRDRGWEVTAVDDLSSGRRENVPSGIDFRVVDVRDDALDELFAEKDFDLVNHQAAQIDVRVSVDRPRHDASVNLDGLLHVLEAARESGVDRVVFASSGGVLYGEADRIPTPETSPKLPVSPYGVAKLAGEHYLFAYRKTHGLEYAALRYANVYGPRQDPHGEAGVVALFGGRLDRGEDLTIYGDGEQTRDYVHVEDVARANVLASEMELGEPHLPDDVAYNVGTGRETSVNELAETMIEVADVDVGREHAPPRPGELQRSALDPDRLAGAGWSARRELAEGLLETYRHIREQE